MVQQVSGNPLRELPSVDFLLSRQEFSATLLLYGRDQVRVQIRSELERLRGEIRAGGGSESVDTDERVAALAGRVREGLERTLGSPIRRVLNATGVFLHTNLGRAPLPPAVASALPALLDASCDLEFDLGRGERGDRNDSVAALLCALTGAESALVVNNNAAALVLILSACSQGREVIVSRGELVEIGGSFRIPDILQAAGVELVEVGTTNRTRASDYERAIGPDTGLLLKVHTSNYRQVGFVEAVAPGELVALGKRHGIPVVADEGAGLLRPHKAPQLAGHPSLSELIADGCDLACGSGDKVLGGPQAGLIVGRSDLVERCRRHPLYRALRPDRTALTALAAVLRLHLAGSELPLDRLWADPRELRPRLESVGARIGAEVVEAEAFVGGGAAPAEAIVGEALALPESPVLLAELRAAEPPVVGYIRHGRLVLDLRTVNPADDEVLVTSVQAALRS